MLPITILPVGLIVLALAACGVAGSSGFNPAHGPALSCTLAVTERGGQLQIEGQLQAAAAVTGRYALKVVQTGQAGQNFIDQSGDFTARAGETVMLGSASVSGPVAQYDATLTLDYADGTLSCPVTVAGR
jgi:hypothetical protein